HRHANARPGALHAALLPAPSRRIDLRSLGETLSRHLLHHGLERFLTAALFPRIDHLVRVEAHRLRSGGHGPPGERCVCLRVAVPRDEAEVLGDLLLRLLLGPAYALAGRAFARTLAAAGQPQQEILHLSELASEIKKLRVSLDRIKYVIELVAQ